MAVKKKQPAKKSKGAAPVAPEPEVPELEVGTLTVGDLPLGTAFRVAGTDYVLLKKGSGSAVVQKSAGKKKVSFEAKNGEEVVFESESTDGMTISLGTEVERILVKKSGNLPVPTITEETVAITEDQDGKNVKVKVKRHVYRIGDVELILSNANSVGTLVTKDVPGMKPADWRKVVEYHGEEITEDVGDDGLKVMAQSFIQNDWYILMKGGLPKEVILGHSKNLKKHTKGKSAKPAKGAAPGKRKSESTGRSQTAYRLTKDPAKLKKVDTLKGQGLLIVNCLKKLGTGTVNEISEAVDKTKQLKTKQPTKTVVNFYASQFKKAGLFVPEAK